MEQVITDTINIRDVANLYECIPDIHFWIKDTNGKFLAANIAFVGHLGLKSWADLKNKTDFDVSQYNLAKEYVKDDQLVLKNARPIKNKMELVADNDGKLRWFATSKVRLFNKQGRIWGTMGYTRKIDQDAKHYLPSKGLTLCANYINEHYDNNISINDLAKQAQLSLVQFERNFKKVFHTTPLKYINGIRIKAACKLLLHTDLGIKAVSQQTGFKDQSYFTKQFFKVLGILPRDYRNKNRG